MKNTISLTKALLISTFLLSSPAFAADEDDTPTVSAYPTASSAPAAAAAPTPAPATSMKQSMPVHAKRMKMDDDDIDSTAVAGAPEDDMDNQGAPSPFAEATAPASAAPVTSGGVGEEDLARLKSIQSQYDLKLLITEANGIFLSDVNVEIADMKGNVLVSTQTEGPVLLAKLPSGKYKLTARRHDSEVKTRQVVVKTGKLSAYQITFKDTDDKISGDPKTTSLY